MRFILAITLMIIVIGCDKKSPTTGDGNKTSGPEPNQSSEIPSIVKSAPTSREPIAKLSAIELFDEYGKNTLAADKKYKDKPVEITGWGIIGREGERYTFGFQIISFPGMTQTQLARLSPRERKWFQDGGYPPNVIAYLNTEGETMAADYKGGETIRLVGFVKGTKKADAWRDHVVVLEDCTLRPIDKKPKSE